MVNIVKLIIIHVPYYIWQLLYNLISFMVNQIYQALYNVTYYQIYYPLYYIGQIQMYTLYFQKVTLYNFLYYTAQTIWHLISNTKMLLYNIFYKLMGYSELSILTVIKNFFNCIDWFWVIVFIAFFVVTFYLAKKRVKSSTRQVYIGSICVILPFSMMQSELNRQRVHEKLHTDKNFDLLNSQIMLDENKYVLGEKYMFQENAFNSFTDWAIWIDENDKKFDISDFYVQETNKILILQTQNYLNTDQSIYNYLTQLNNDFNYTNFVIDLIQKPSLSYNSNECGLNSSLKIDSFWSMRFPILENYLVEKIEKMPKDKNKMLVLKGDNEILQHGKKLENLIKKVLESSENLNVILLLTNTQVEIKLPELNFKNQLKYVKLEQRRFDPTVEQFTKMLEKHLLEKQNFQNKILLENSVRNFVAKLGTNFNYFLEYMKTGDNITLDKFVNKKLREKKGIFGYLNNEIDTYIYQSKIVEAIKKKNSNNSWVDLIEINGIYNDFYTHTPSQSLESLIKHDIIVSKGMRVRFVKNELYHAYLLWKKHNKRDLTQ